MRSLEIAISIIRGALLSVFNSKAIGRNLRVYNNVSLIIHKGGMCKIGRNVKINKNATISVLSKGKLQIDNSVSIGQNSYIVAHQSIHIGADTIMGQNVMIYDHDHKFDTENGVCHKEFLLSPVSIGEKCWIGANTIILRGTTIGDHCVVGAGSVLKGEYPSGTVIVQKRKTDIYIKGEA